MSLDIVPCFSLDWDYSLRAAEAALEFDSRSWDDRRKALREFCRERGLVYMEDDSFGWPDEPWPEIVTGIRTLERFGLAVPAHPEWVEFPRLDARDMRKIFGIHGKPEHPYVVPEWDGILPALEGMGTDSPHAAAQMERIRTFMEIAQMDGFRFFRLRWLE